MSEIDAININEETAITDQPTISYGWCDSFHCFQNVQLFKSLDQITIENVINLPEGRKQWNIRNKQGEIILHAMKIANEHRCGTKIESLKIFDNSNNQLLDLYKSSVCTACCIFGCTDSIEVASLPDMTVIGRVELQRKCFSSRFAVLDENGDTVLRIEGPCNPVTCCGDEEFTITSTDGSRILGNFSKTLNKCELDAMAVSFPIDLDIQIKAVLLSASFLIKSNK